MKIKLSKKKQILKESKQKEKNFFRATDSAERTLQERVDNILREELEGVIAEKVNPLEIKRQICDKKSMIVKAIEAGQVNNMLWWAEALGIIPDEMEKARASLQKLLGTDPDKLLQIPGAKEGAIAAIEMMCMIPLEESKLLTESASRGADELHALIDGLGTGDIRDFNRISARDEACQIYKIYNKRYGMLSTALKNEDKLSDSYSLTLSGPKNNKDGEWRRIIRRFYRACDREDAAKAKAKAPTPRSAPRRAAPDLSVDIDEDEARDMLNKIEMEWESKRHTRKSAHKLYSGRLAPLIGKLNIAVKHGGWVDDGEDFKPVRRDAIALGKSIQNFLKALSAQSEKDTGEYGKSSNWSLGPVSVEGRARYRKFYSDLKKYNVDPKLLGRADFVWGPKHDRAYAALLKKVKGLDQRMKLTAKMLKQLIRETIKFEIMRADEEGEILDEDELEEVYGHFGASHEPERERRGHVKGGPRDASDDDHTILHPPAPGGAPGVAVRSGGSSGRI